MLMLARVGGAATATLTLVLCGRPGWRAAGGQVEMLPVGAWFLGEKEFGCCPSCPSRKRQREAASKKDMAAGVDSF